MSWKTHGAYLKTTALEKVFGSQDVALGKVQGTLASPQHSDRERVGEEAAWFTRFLREGTKQNNYIQDIPNSLDFAAEQEQICKKLFFNFFY